MLWYKAWLETRWRMLMPVGMFVFVLVQIRSQGIGAQFPSAALLDTFTFFWLTAPVFLAGAGIQTESTFRYTRGFHGSMYFTLSLPVSRLRLLAVRAGVGMLETAFVIFAICCIAGITVPELRTRVALPDAIRYVLTIFLCSLAFYALSVLIATFVDQIWQVQLTMLAVILLRWGVIPRVVQPPFNVFRAMGNSSPLITHTIPYTAIGVSLAAAAIFFVAAAKVVQIQEH